MNQRKMRIGMSIRGHGYHPAAWRHSDVAADCTLHVEHYVRSAQTAERGKLDMIFFADGAGIRQGDNPPGSLARTGRDMIELEPTMLLRALNTLSALQQGRGGDLFGLPDVPPSTKMKLVE